MPGMTILPQFQGDYYHLQNQQALAQALMQQSFQPQNTQAVGSGQYSIVPKYSPVGGLAQLGQALIAAKMQNQVAQGYQTLGQNQWSALTGSPPAQQSAPQQTTDAGGMTDNQSGPGVTSTPVPMPGQPTPQAYASALGATGGVAPQQGGGLLSPGGPLNPNGMPTTAAAMMYMSPEGQKELFKSTAAAYAPTAATLQARQGGFDTAQANQRAFAHDTFNAPVTGTGIFRDPYSMKPVAFNPEIPSGGTPLFDASGNVGAINSIPNAQNVMQGNASATAAGSAQFKPVQVYNRETNQMEYSNEAAVTNPAPGSGVGVNNPGNLKPGGKFAQYPDMQTGLAALDNNLQSYGKSGINTVEGVINKWAPPSDNNDTKSYIQDVQTRLGLKPGQKIDLSNPLQRQALSTAIALHENGPSGVFGSGQGTSSGRPAAAPPLGATVTADKGAGNLQDELSKKWTDLSNQNLQSQSTISYLQNIKDLASKAAVGPMSDRLNFVNGLLSMAGPNAKSIAGSERAVDAVTANNLLDKYSNQITARLSANGMSTDSARSILQSAYPNSKMNQPAINEAADNLIGASQMTQAKARLLTPLANARNATEYNNTETKFDQAADPRIWQLQNMAPADQAKYVASLSPSVAQMLFKNRQVLKGMGAL
jgi:hypothetical protein